MTSRLPTVSSLIAAASMLTPSAAICSSMLTPAVVAPDALGFDDAAVPDASLLSLVLTSLASAALPSELLHCCIGLSGSRFDPVPTAPTNSAKWTFRSTPTSSTSSILDTPDVRLGEGTPGLRSALQCCFVHFELLGSPKYHQQKCTNLQGS